MITGREARVPALAPRSRDGTKTVVRVRRLQRWRYPHGSGVPAWGWSRRRFMIDFVGVAPGNATHTVISVFCWRSGPGLVVVTVVDGGGESVCMVLGDSAGRRLGGAPGRASGAGAGLARASASVLLLDLVGMVGLWGSAASSLPMHAALALRSTGEARLQGAESRASPSHDGFCGTRCCGTTNGAAAQDGRADSLRNRSHRCNSFHRGRLSSAPA